MAEKELTLTAEGREKLVEELAYREGDLAKEIVERIKTARGFGDLSENSEFDDAKDEQAKNEARIAEIRKILATARVADDAEAATTADGVSIGCTVTVADEKGAESVFTIVGTMETDSLHKRISNESPIGAALIGAIEGETVEYATPSGKTRSFKVVKIER